MIQRITVPKEYRPIVFIGLLTLLFFASSSLLEFTFEKRPDVLKTLTIKAAASEFSHRVTWLMTTLMAMLAAMGTCVFSYSILVHTDMPRKRTISLIITIGAALVGVLEYLGNIKVLRDPVVLVVKEILLTNVSYQGLGFIRSFSGVITIIVILHVTMAGCALLRAGRLSVEKASENKNSPEAQTLAANEIGSDIDLFCRLIYVSSFTFVLSLISIRFFFGWIESASNYDQIRDIVSELTKASLTRWGSLISMYMLTVCLTVFLYIDEAARSLPDLRKLSRAKQQLALQELGLVMKINDKWGRAVAIALPLLSGTVDQIPKLLSSALTGGG